MPETLAPPKKSNRTIEVDEALASMNGDGIISDLHLFWLIVRRFRWLFVGVFLFLFALSYWYFNYEATYRATAKFTISDWSQSYPPSNSNSIFTPDRVNQMLMLFISDSVVQFLIDKYNMKAGLKHPDDVREQEELHAGIASSIILEQSLFNSFNLVVSTSDRVLSANLANDLVEKVKQTSRQLYAHDLANRIDVLKKLVNSAFASDTSSDDVLTRHFDIIQDQLNHLASTQLSVNDLRIVMNELDMIQKKYDDRMIQVKLNELMLKQLSSSGTGSITLIQKAIPDFTDYTFIRLAYSLIIAVLSCAMLPLIIYPVIRIRAKEMIDLQGRNPELFA